MIRVLRHQSMITTRIKKYTDDFKYEYDYELKKDLRQECLLKLLIIEGEHTQAYYTSAINSCIIDYIRRYYLPFYEFKAGFQARDEEGRFIAGQFIPNVEETQVQPNMEVNMMLKDAMLKLTDYEARLFVAKVIYGLTFEKIGVYLNKSRQTISKDYKKIQVKLQKLMEV